MRLTGNSKARVIAVKRLLVTCIAVALVFVELDGCANERNCAAVSPERGTAQAVTLRDTQSPSAALLGHWAQVDQRPPVQGEVDKLADAQLYFDGTNWYEVYPNLEQPPVEYAYRVTSEDPGKRQVEIVWQDPGPDNYTTTWDIVLDESFQNLQITETFRQYPSATAGAFRYVDGERVPPPEAWQYR
jgi:hypothetical protein